MKKPLILIALLIVILTVTSCQTTWRIHRVKTNGYPPAFRN